MMPKAKLILRRLGDGEATQIVGVKLLGQYYELAGDSEIAINTGPNDIANLTLTLMVSSIEFEDEERP